MPRHSAKTAHVGLAGAQAGAQASYGATTSSDTASQGSETGDAAGAGPGTGEKQFKSFRETWILCLGLWIITFASSVSATITANNKLEIGTFFRASSMASWLGTGFLLGLTALAPLFGRLSDVMGRRNAMLLSLSVFILGSILCAIATSMYSLIAARFLVGVGSGGAMTISAIIISDQVSLRDRGLYQGIVSLMYGLGSAVGAAAGGALTDLYGWRAAFWVQCPLPLASAAVMIWQLDPSSGKTEGTAWEKIKVIDWAGALILLLNISALTVGTSLFTTAGYEVLHPIVIGLYAVFVVTTILFYKLERRATRPILPPQVLGQLQPLVILLAFTFQSASLTGRLYMQPVYLHISRGLGGTQTGMVLAPSAVVGPFMSTYAGWHIRHFKEYTKLQTALSTISWIQAAGFCLSWGLTTSLTRIIIELIFAGLGAGMFTTLLIALFAVIGPKEQGIAVAASYVARALGQVIGIGISAPLQQVLLARDLSSRLEGMVPESTIRALIQEPLNVLPGLDLATQLQARLAYMTSLRAVFGLTIVMGIVTTILCLTVRGKKL